jgi:hypothetical protein
MLGIVLSVLALFGAAQESFGPADAAPRSDVTVSVLDVDGQPASTVDIQLHVALVRDDLTPTYDVWRSLESMNRQTRSEGTAVFKDMPTGARLTAFARGKGGFGVAHGVGDLQVELQPTGTVTGSVNIKDAKLRRLHNIQLSHESGWNLQTERMDAKGNYTFYDVPPGAIEVSVQRGEWVCERRTGKVKPGKTTKIKAFRPKEGRYEDDNNPRLDVPRVEIVGDDGEPQQDVTFWWTSPTGFGVGVSDERGVVEMDGTGFFVGKPPFLLMLGLIGQPQSDDAEDGIENNEAVRWLGEVTTVRRSGAVVQLSQRLRRVTGRLLVDGEPAELYRVAAVSGLEDARRIWWGFVSPGPDQHNPIQRRKDEERGVRPRGVYSLWVPPGELSLRVVTLDGAAHDIAFDLPEGRGDFSHEITLP